MIRIVGIQRSESPQKEFVLLQNQGGLRVNLRGHVIMSETALEVGHLGELAHVFKDEALIPPGMYILLHTGSGEPRWTKTKDQALVYYTYMHRENPVWARCSGGLHLLNTQHTYTERREAVLMR